MSQYPQLTEMGVHNPEQIEKYMVNGMPTYDVLRIVYARQEGSLLPTSRTYKFTRVQKEVAAQNSEGKSTTVLETHPGLRVAIAELKQLLEIRNQKNDVKEDLLEQIKLLEDDLMEQVRILEEDIAERTKYLERLAEKL